MTEIKFGPRVWVEDDCTRGLPDHEHVEEKFMEMFGYRFKDAKVVAVDDRGDAFVYLCEHGVAVTHCPEGFSINVLSRTS